MTLREQARKMIKDRLQKAVGCVEEDDLVRASALIHKIEENL